MYQQDRKQTGSNRIIGIAVLACVGLAAMALFSSAGSAEPVKLTKPAEKTYSVEPPKVVEATVEKPISTKVKTTTTTRTEDGSRNAASGRSIGAGNISNNGNGKQTIINGDVNINIHDHSYHAEPKKIPDLGPAPLSVKRVKECPTAEAHRMRVAMWMNEMGFRP